MASARSLSKSTDLERRLEECLGREEDPDGNKLWYESGIRYKPVEVSCVVRLPAGGNPLLLL